MHLKATSAYQKPKSFENQFLESKPIERINLFKSKLYLLFFTKLSYYSNSLTIQKNIAYKIYLSLLILVFIPFSFLLFIISLSFQFVRDRHHEKVIERIGIS